MKRRRRSLVRQLSVGLATLICVWPAVARAQSNGAVRKEAADSIWKKIFVIGGETNSDTFVEPRQLVVTGDVLVVLDAGTREVRGFDAHTGQPRFVLKATGVGPGEFRRPSQLASTPTGFGILDQADARFTTFDRKGTAQWTAVVSNVFSTNGICVQNAVGIGMRVTSTISRHDSSIVAFDSTGKQRAVLTIPWKEYVRGGVEFAYNHHAIVSSPGGDCVVAPMFGSEWAVVPARGAPRVYRYVEPGPQPVVAVNDKVLERTITKVTIQHAQTSDTPQAARFVVSRGDTVIVNAAASKTFPSRWLDYYRLSTGQYLYSRKLPVACVGIAIADDGTFYLSVITSTQQFVVAMRPSAPNSLRR